MSPEEWDELPWYQQQIYLNGFREEGILKKEGDEESAPAPTPRGPTSGGGKRKIDLTSADLSELGDSFTVRRAG